MDIVKLLSRSTKQTRNSSYTAAIPLPSAGQSANPQLYHDQVSELRGKKRKQADVGKEEIIEQSSDDELNFFATKTEKKKSTKKLATNRDGKTRGANPADEEENVAVKLLDEGECRLLLRSHRLKVTILPPAKATEKVSKKQSKKGKSHEIDVKKKDEYKQIFPQPLIAFQDLRSTYGISRRLAENISQQGYNIPTEVQMGSLPLLLRQDIALSATVDCNDALKKQESIDLLAVAPTGSGKTLAFLIPVLNGIMQRRHDGRSSGGHSLDAIIVAPTKELASQIVNEGRKLAVGTGIKVVEMRKGMRVVSGNDVDDEISVESASESEEDEESETENTTGKVTKQSNLPVTKADVLVTTPLVLLHALSTASGNKSPLPSVRHLVLDEADVLLDQLFREQTVGIWDACINPDLHVTLWSATMGSNIEALTSSTIQSRSHRLKLSVSFPLIRLVVGLKDSAIPNITHRLIYAATESGKLLALRQLLHPTAPANPNDSSSLSLRPPFLVFTQTIPRAIALHSELLYDIPTEAGGPSRIAVLHSDLSSPAREAIMSRFRLGEIWVLITTDILSRGVDFRGINAVVNYDVPNSGAAYIHRVGRTGRAGRNGGVAVTLYTKEDIPYVKNVANIIAASEKAAGKEGEGSVQKWLLDALPTPSKKAKQELKRKGVEARRTGKAKISTKSGYERKLENRKKGAIKGSQRRIEAEATAEEDAGEESEWGGIEE